MVFWLTAAVITALVAAPLAIALLRGRGGRRSVTDVQIYRDQLEEVDRDLERGVIGEDEAERIRLEVSRRLLDASKQEENAPQSVSHASPLLAGMLVAALFGGAYLLYRQIGAPFYPDMPLEARLEMAQAALENRPSQAEIEGQVPVQNLAPDASQERLDLIERLRVALQGRQDDLEGHILLARNEAALGNFVSAHQAQARVIAIKGDEATAADYADYADMMVLAAGGFVSPEAEAALNKALELDPQNGVARYYLGLMYAQTGRPDKSFEIWSKLLDESLPQAPWVPPVRAQIEIVARDAGIRYELPAIDAGPTAADIAASQDMTPEERRAMIRSMVERLSTRLTEEGGTPREWGQLIGALAVLNRDDDAREIWTEAQSVFAEAPEALALVRAAAERAGIADQAPDQAPGPTAADVQAAQSMSDEDRSAMIRSMVARLSDRLNTEGGPPSDWARLINAYGVLEMKSEASDAWQAAQEAFAGDAAAIEAIRPAAQNAGVTP